MGTIRKKTKKFHLSSFVHENTSEFLAILVLFYIFRCDQYFVYFIYFNSVGRGKILSYSDLISVLAMYIDVQLRGPSLGGEDQLGFPRKFPDSKSKLDISVRR